MSIAVTRKIALPAAVAVIVLACGAAAGQAAPVASKLALTSRFGWDVNKTAAAAGAEQAEENVCTVASRDECQQGEATDQIGGFSYPHSVAVDNDPASPRYGDVYVADNGADVQIFTAAGEFVGVFGWDVNRTAVEAGGDQSEKNLCTAESGDECQTGTTGEAAGQMFEPFSVAVDPNTGDVYLFERVVEKVVEQGDAVGYRVQAFSAEGEWLFEIGQEVDGTTNANLCTRQDSEKGESCTGPATFDEETHSSSGQGAFQSEAHGDEIAVGGPEDLLYVGDEHRVQEFTATGEWHGEIPLTSLSAAHQARVQALAVDEAGDVYLTYAVEAFSPTVREYGPGGTEATQFEVTPKAVPAGFHLEAFFVSALAIDPTGRLAVSGIEKIQDNENAAVTSTTIFGFLYSGAGARLSEFTPPSGARPSGLAFAASDKLYAATDGQVVDVFSPVLFPETTTCMASDVTATSATLCGQIDPIGLPAEGLFEYGPPAGSRTPVAFEGSGEAPEAVSWQLGGLVPNQTYTYEMAAEALVGGETIAGSGEPVSFHTATPPPEIAGVPSAASVSSTFALLTATVNPEHAATRYRFEYGRCPTLSGCAETFSTPAEESAVYGAIAVAEETAGLQPASSYSFRVVADNEHEEAGGAMQGGSAIGAEGHFTTLSLPTPIAETGIASAVGVSTATISGVVDPDGQASVYAFELGVYRGGETSYGIVYSGPAQASSSPVPVSLGLSGLQSGTTYAYRVTLRSGYGESVGATATFTTEGLPAVLPVTPELSMLPVPEIKLPKIAKKGGSGKHKKRGSHTKCAKRTGKHARRSCVRKKRDKPGRRTTRMPNTKR